MKNWYLVANSAIARVFSTDGDVSKARPVRAITNPEGREHERDLASDRPGRKIDGSGSFSVAASSFREHSVDTFARQLAQEMEREHAMQHFDRLTIVAPPRMLGKLRAAMNRRATALIAAEHALDIAQLSDDDVKTHLDKLATS